MKPNLLLLLFVTLVFSASAQTDTIAPGKPQRPSIAFINTMDGKKIKGWLYKTDTAALYLLHLKTKPLPPLNSNIADLNYPGYTIDALQINTMGLKKRRAGLRGMLIGMGTGIVVGAVVGFASGDDPQEEWFALTAGEKAVGLGLLGGSVGALIGVIAGALSKQVFIIGGKKDAYQNAREELNRRSIVKF